MGPLWTCMEQNKDYYAPQLESLEKRSEGEPGYAYALVHVKYSALA